MRPSLFNVSLFYLLLLPLVFESLFSACTPPSTVQDSVTWVNAITINAPGIQRENTSFTLKNLSKAIAHWEYKIMDAESGKVMHTTTEFNPVISLPRGCYDVLVTAKGKNTLARHFRRYLTVLPAPFTETEADEVIDLSSISTASFIKDFGKKVRPGYKIMIKGSYNGRIKFTGLQGTRKNPVHIINQGQVIIHATNERAPYAFQWSDDNQYILWDGKADPKIPYGFLITGHPEKSGQVVFIAGVFNKGFEICGLKIIGRQGITNGAAAIQVQTSYTPECNASNWNFEYFKAHHNKIAEASSEGMYIGYFTDSPRQNGFTPFRLGQVLIYRDSIINSGWDAIQIASADEFEVHDNYIDGASLSGKRSHSSFLSWNSGNKTGWCYRNTCKNAAHAASIIYGETGKEAFIYSNLFIDGAFPSNITTSAFFFSKLNNAFQSDVALYIFNNTIITSRIPAKIDYKNKKESAGMPVVFAGNAILLDRLNLKRYPEIAMGSKLQDSLSWTINNVWRMKEKAAELKLDANFKPAPTSPLLQSDFKPEKYFDHLKGGFYDKDGYPLYHEEKGYTFGCYSAHAIPGPNL